MTPQGPKAEPHALEYSVSTTEGLPKFHPQAEAMIYLGEPPQALLAAFDKPLDAVRYYGMSMSRRYDASRLENVCVLCGGEATERMVRVGWKARVRVSLAPIAAGFWDRDRTCDFFTLHSICLPCYRGWRGRSRRAALWIIGMSGLVLLAMTALSIHAALLGRSPGGAVLGLLGFAFLIGVAAATILQKLVWRRPRPLRRIAPHEVTLNGDLELLRRPAAVAVERGNDA